MKVSLVCDPKSEVSVNETRKILKLLKKNGFEAVPDTTLKGVCSNAKPIEKADSEMVIATGDAGTILRTFSRLSKKEIPVLGVNTGSVGFLTEIEPYQFRKVVDRIKNKEYSIERRNRISAKINSKCIAPALNELGIFSKKAASLMRYTLKIDDELVWRDGADGVIISTPTGSTGHSMSAGGPILAPKSGTMLITPVTSINQSSRPVVLSNASKIAIDNISCGTGCELIIDGQARFKLNESVVLIEKAEKDALFVRFGEEKFSSLTGKLKKKINIYEKDIESLPPSAKFLFKLLNYEGTLTQKEIIDESSLPSRTVRHALNILLNKELIAKRASLRDTRQDLYSVK